MPGRELALELLAAAESDLKALRHMLDRSAFDDGIFGFHAQQSVEKTLKAWLNLLGHSHPFTHDLSLLLSAIDEAGADVDDCWDFLDLSGFATRFRYEILPEGEEPLERERLIERVQNLMARVRASL